MINVKELVIYPSSECNLHCKHCYTNKEPYELGFDDLKWIKQTFNPRKTIIMGGEPLLYNELEYILHIFPNVTISTNAVYVEKKLDMLQNYRNKLTLQLSIEGSKEETNTIRGEMIWEICMHMAKLLQKHSINFYFRASYHQDNLNDIVKYVLPLAKQFNVGVMLLPRIDLPSLDGNTQAWFFQQVIGFKNCAVAQPHFFQFIDKPGRCKAGDERINIYFDKRITPCNFDLEYTLGHIGDDEKTIVSNMKMFVENFKVPPAECSGCPQNTVCKGSCYISKSYIGCPLRYNVGINTVIMKSNLDEKTVKQEMNLLTNYVKDLGIC